MAEVTAEFDLLGPLRVCVAGRPVDVKSVRQRTLIALLAWHAGHAVPRAQLVEAVWGDDQPADSRASLHSQVMRLRRTLDGAGSLIQVDGHGYRLDIDPQACDAHRFRALVRSSHTVAKPAQLLREALDLWRGDPLTDVRPESLTSIAVALGEERLDALERRIAIDLADGRHLSVVGELAHLTQRSPFREQFWAQLMIALSGSGRQAEALAAFGTVRTLLRDELGLEPGSELQRVRGAILSGTIPPADTPPVLESAPSWLVQRRLPLSITDFVGRTELADAIAESLLDERSVPIAVISGLAGAGKSALALHVAHRVSESFPDGQWHVLLGAGSAQPRSPEQLLEALLRTSGAGLAALPTDLDAMSGLLRARLSGRRVLLVLDDAASASQVKVLLPGTAGCAVLVTSRPQLAELTALHGARPYPLGALLPAESLALLGSMLGSGRIGGETDAAREIAVLCGHLPLALRIAAANLAHQPALALDRYVERLRQNRLGVLAIPSSPVVLRDAFAVSVASVSAAARRAFALLGCVPGADVPTDAATALFGLSRAAAERELDELCVANLLTRTHADRYRMHDLLREHAVAMANSGNAGERAARERLFAWYRQRVEDANVAADLTSIVRLPHPAGDPNTFADRADALAWLDVELANLSAMVVQAADLGLAHYAWEITDGLRLLLDVRRRLSTWRSLVGAALRAAETAGNQLSVAAMQHSSAVLATCSGDRDQARLWYERAVVGYRRSGFGLGEAALLNNLGVLSTEALELTDALGYFDRAAAAFQSAGRADLVTMTISNRSAPHLLLGQLESAVEDGTTALRCAGHRAHVVARVNRAAAYRQLGRLAQAHADATASFELCRHRGEVDHLAAASLELARCCLALGRHQDAVALAEDAERLASQTGAAPRRGQALAVLGAAHRVAGRPDIAISACRRAIAHAEDGAQLHSADALIGLAGALYDSGEIGRAVVEAARAVRLAHFASLRVDECRALGILAVAHRDLGQCAEADVYAEAAATISRETGYVPVAHELHAPRPQ